MRAVGTERTCRACETTKPLTEFHRTPNGTGRIGRCRDCINANNKVRRGNDAAYKAKHSAYNREWYRKNYARARHGIERARLKFAYGVTPEQIADARQAQNNLCAICKRPRFLVIDHDHRTGRFRGMLCKACNIAIGQFGDNSEGLRIALAYLERNEAEDRRLVAEGISAIK